VVSGGLQRPPSSNAKPLPETEVNNYIVMIEVAKISKQYSDAGKKIQVIDRLSFTLDKGSSVALMGQSGAGKSTLLHLLGGFDHADSGHITIAGQCLTAMNDRALSRFRRQHLGMVFQHYNLIDSLTAVDNITFVRRLNGLSPLDDYSRHLIELLRLSDRMQHLPHQLSGGEQQRVAIARALAAKPSVLLADEPTGNLDEDTAALVMKQLADVASMSGTTLFLVTHSAVTASYLQQIWLLEKGRLRC